MSKLLPTSAFKCIDPKEFDLNRYTSNSSKGCVLEVDFESPKESRKLLSDYPLASDKTEIKREMLSEYRLKTADHYNIPIAIAKKFVPELFDKEKYAIHYENLKLYLSLGLKIKKIQRLLELHQFNQWLKQYNESKKKKKKQQNMRAKKMEKHCIS